MKKILLFSLLLSFVFLTNSAQALKLGNPLKGTKPSVGGVPTGKTADKNQLYQEMQSWIAKPIKEFIDFYTNKYGTPTVIDGDSLDCWGFTNTDGKPFRIINYNNQSHSAPSLQDGYPCKQQGS